MKNQSFCYVVIGLVILVVFILIFRGSFTISQSPIVVDTKPREVKTIEGYVISGGDMTPKELYDAPRTFTYAVKTNDGSIAHVSYTAYPPVPNEEALPKIRVQPISINGYLKAKGTFNKKTNSILVEQDGDYIETSKSNSQ